MSARMRATPPRTGTYEPFYRTKDVIGVVEVRPAPIVIAAQEEQQKKESVVKIVSENRYIPGLYSPCGGVAYRRAMSVEPKAVPVRNRRSEGTAVSVRPKVRQSPVFGALTPVAFDLERAAGALGGGAATPSKGSLMRGVTAACRRLLVWRLLVLVLGLLPVVGLGRECAAYMTPVMIVSMTADELAALKVREETAAKRQKAAKSGLPPKAPKPPKGSPLPRAP
ncbi:unnamed protein product [Vitrella brassicaformis CCMP3155]|uniref:Uncharacterized protein n=1 Tax=Vitrella brassicaformis (strain CCMP3155) TaxID=1169540 RepID=A0A0G4EUP1_VITBC|nr:unnamed protein product [Vitrella brassicaformis CCMP3155]|eukprot:CEM01958.1 unnamed protein product [Vitrella brassicaformis CCMP3155]